MYQKHCSKLLIYLLCLVGLKLLKYVWNSKVAFILARNFFPGDLAVDFTGVVKGGFVHICFGLHEESRGYPSDVFLPMFSCEF
jgi:hypothetical protein